MDKHRKQKLQIKPLKITEQQDPRVKHLNCEIKEVC